MLVTLNGDARQLPENCTVAQLIETLDLGNQRYAVEINEELVPRSTHADHPLRAGDQVEIVNAIGGG